MLLVHLKRGFADAGRRRHEPRRERLSRRLCSRQASRNWAGACATARRRQLLEYLALIEKWNRVYNLTAMREPEQMVSASSARQPRGRCRISPAAHLLDVGSGAGLPGIPLAIARPGRGGDAARTQPQESAFLKQAAIELGLRQRRGRHASASKRGTAGAAASTS